MRIPASSPVNRFATGLFLQAVCLIVLFAPAAFQLVRAENVLSAAMACPDGAADFSRSLNGVWNFKYIPALDAGPDERFFAPEFDAAAWKPITVPGHWELQGFAEPRYEGDLQEGLGLHRRAFRVDQSWRGRRVFLRFEGVLYGFTVYVNGKTVGEWASGFNQSTFDITDALTADGAENILAVRVSTRSKGWDFDTMDCWSISGIYRDVTLFSLPEAHLKDYTTRTTLLPDGSARLDVDLVASAAGRVEGRLLAPDGATAGLITVSVPADGRTSAALIVEHPALWSAESPSLYRLELAFESAEGESVHRVATRVGVRQVAIEDGVLKLNGSPIKLRGVNHHEIWPEGRVSTEENTRRDLTLIRDANINFVRTSHYPPHPRLLELCDEMGLYVLDEVPFIHGRQHLKDPAYQETLYTRARATVARDKNHASVLFWSVGNENPVNELGNNTGKLVKQLDPTRPVMFPTIGSYFAENHPRMSDAQDIYAPHYPALKRVREYARTLTRPILFTEYAHQRGLARAGTAVQDLWEQFYQSPRIAGGAVWVFQDQGLLRTTDDATGVKDGDLMAWIDAHRYYDTHGFFAMDGLVYSDRTPQTDYWLVRKVYSPVQIKERAPPARPGDQMLSFDVENRHDFRSLAGFHLVWALQQNGSVLRQGSVALAAPPKRTETVSVSVSLPAKPEDDVFTFALRCEDETGRSIYERDLRLDTGLSDGARLSALRASVSAGELGLDQDDDRIVVRHPGYRLELGRHTGRLALRKPDGEVLVSDFGPHTGRNPTINDMGKGRERLPELWAGSLLTEVTDLKTEARRTAEGIEITVGGRYPRPGKPEEAVVGACTLRISPDGVIEVGYDYAPEHATGELLEAGFALSVPAAQSEFRWLGEGPYAGYPGKDRLNEYGLFHLNRDDLYFPGNRRAVELALLAQPSGPGLLLAGSRLTVDLEKQGEATILSHLACVPGERGAQEGQGENVDISARLKAASLNTISGRFILLPLSSEWPGPLVRWFGAPDRRVPVLKPFLRSYDQ